MLGIETMLVRLGIAVLLGAIIGVERELAGKSAGIRTDILVAAGAAIFAIAGGMLPYIFSVNDIMANQIITQNAGYLNVIANIVIGIGFLGTGIIVQQGGHVFGVTTAATVWLVAAIGLLCGIGLTTFAIIATLLIVFLLGFLRSFDILKLFRKKGE
jgi:putative Mg2+ transporter-C (MgtC) family protein